MVRFTWFAAWQATCLTSTDFDVYFCLSLTFKQTAEEFLIKQRVCTSRFGGSKCSSWRGQSCKNLRFWTDAANPRKRLQTKEREKDTRQMDGA